MKKTKTWLAVVLYVILIASLLLYAKYSSSILTPAQLEGRWTTTVPATDYVAQIVKSGLGVDCTVEEALEITYVFEYFQDGSMTLCLDPASAQALVDSLKKTVEKSLPDALYANLEQTNGFTREEADAYLTVQGKDINSLVQESMESINFDGILTRETTPMVMYYTLKENQLYYASTAETLEAGEYALRVDPVLKGKTLTLGNAVDAQGTPYEGSAVVKYPMTLTKQ